MMTSLNNLRTRILAQAVALLFVIATGGLLLLTLSERTVNSNTNASYKTPWLCPRQTVEQRVAAADLIVTGTVFAVIPDNDEAGVLITPQRVYRGSLPPNGIVVAARSADRTTSNAVTGDLHFTSDDPPYLLFLKQRSDDRFATSACFGARLLGDGLTPEEQTVLNVSE